MKTLEGRYSIHKQLGQFDYHLFELPQAALRLFSAVIREAVERGKPVQVEIGPGRIRFESSSQIGFTAGITDLGGILIHADPRSLLSLADGIDALVRAIPDPDYVPHVHFDNFFSLPPLGLSDVVLQRCDE